MLFDFLYDFAFSNASLTGSRTGFLGSKELSDSDEELMGLNVELLGLEYREDGDVFVGLRGQSQGELGTEQAMATASTTVFFLVYCWIMMEYWFLLLLYIKKITFKI